MRKLFTLGLVTLSMTAIATAEQNPPQPPTSPQTPVAPVAPMRGDARHQMRAFEFHMGGPDESGRILPPGAWWKDQELARRIDLTTEQQKRIEDTFLQSKIELIHLHASLEEQELLLAPMLDANPIDQGKVLAQISKIADTRAGLEKANAKMLLQIRGVLNGQQWTKLQQERPGMRQRIFVRTPDGPRSYNFTLPDPGDLRMQLENLPAIDGAKLQAQVMASLRELPSLDVEKLRSQALTSLHNLPQIDTEKLRIQMQTALKNMPKLDTEKLLKQMPSLPAEIFIDPAPQP